eukprot:15377-Heterococcus_DN1.PRE.1
MRALHVMILCGSCVADAPTACSQRICCQAPLYHLVRCIARLVYTVMWKQCVLVRRVHWLPASSTHDLQCSTSSYIDGQVSLSYHDAVLKYLAWTVALYTQSRMHTDSRSKTTCRALC